MVANFQSLSQPWQESPLAAPAERKPEVNECCLSWSGGSAPPRTSFRSAPRRRQNRSKIQLIYRHGKWKKHPLELQHLEHWLALKRYYQRLMKHNRKFLKTRKYYEKSEILPEPLLIFRRLLIIGSCRIRFRDAKRSSIRISKENLRRMCTGR